MISQVMALAKEYLQGYPLPDGLTRCGERALIDLMKYRPEEAVVVMDTHDGVPKVVCLVVDPIDGRYCLLTYKVAS